MNFSRTFCAAVQVGLARDGTYEFTFRQAPMVAAAEIEATVASDSVGNGEVSCLVPNGTTGVTLAVEIEAERRRLMTQLIDERSGRSRGACHVEVRRLG